MVHFEGGPHAEENENEDPRQFILDGRYIEAEKLFGDEAIMDLVNELIDSGMAVEALRAADALGYDREAKRAAHTLKTSETYDEECGDEKIIALVKQYSITP